MNITDEQGVKWLLQKMYDVGYRYIAMDKEGEIFLYKNNPVKEESMWSGICGSVYSWLHEAISHLVSWEDKEPFDIGKYLGIVDWANVPVDTKVLVSSDGKKWKKRYFKCYDNVNFEYHYVCFDNGLTSWSDNFENKTCHWRYCKLAEDE